MKTKLTLLCTAAVLLCSGCIVKETVTVNGQVRESGYKEVSSPVQDVWE